MSCGRRLAPPSAMTVIACDRLSMLAVHLGPMGFSRKTAITSGCPTSAPELSLLFIHPAFLPSPQLCDMPLHRRCTGCCCTASSPAHWMYCKNGWLGGAGAMNALTVRPRGREGEGAQFGLRTRVTFDGDRIDVGWKLWV